MGRAAPLYFPRQNFLFRTTLRRRTRQTSIVITTGFGASFRVEDGRSVLKPEENCLSIVLSSFSGVVRALSDSPTKHLLSPFGVWNQCEWCMQVNKPPAK